MGKMPGQVPKYTMKDLVKFVQDFHSQHDRVPKVEDIKVLSKQGKSPCTGVFITHGGLSWVIEQAGFPISTKEVYGLGEEKFKLREFFVIMSKLLPLQMVGCQEGKTLNLRLN